MLTTRPQPRSAIGGTTTRTVWNMPVRLTRTSWSHASGVMSAMRAMLLTMPALFTSTSIVTQLGAAPLGGGGDGVGIGHVDLDLHRPAAQLGHGVGRRHVLVGTGDPPLQPVVALAFEPAGVGVGHGHVGAGTGETQRDGPADATRGAGHERHLPGERHAMRPSRATYNGVARAAPGRSGSHGGGRGDRRPHRDGHAVGSGEERTVTAHAEGARRHRVERTDRHRSRGRRPLAPGPRAVR